MLNSLDGELKGIKLIRRASGLISLSFRHVVKTVNAVDLPQYVEFTCTRSLISGSLDKIGREYGLQRELLDAVVIQKSRGVTITS